MSVNKYSPHVFVLPEDDANRQLANGFQLGDFLAPRRMQVLPVAGGWQEVVSCFSNDHIPEMERNANRFMVLLIDFDKQSNRLANIKAGIPNHLKERVFILGVWSEPEELKRQCGQPYETIGLAMAKDCRENTEAMWTHVLLSHNAGELERMRQSVRPFLFPDH